VLRRARASAQALWRRVGTSPGSHAVRVVLGVVTKDFFVSPINRAIYYSLRLMFIDQLHLDYSFDFASFVERCAGRDLPRRDPVASWGWGLTL
jgi:hypothetical protein